jgi:hypothetical protein
MDGMTVGSAKSLALQTLAHGAVALLLVCTLILLDRMAIGGVALYLATAWAFLSGLGLSHIIHEWCHFLGAISARATITLKPRVHPLFFDFDYSANSPGQFLCLSFGGLLGNVVLLYILVFVVGPHSQIATGLLAAVAGQFVFVLMLELPVSLGVLAGRDPLQTLTAHFGQGGPLFLRAALGGVGTAVLVFLLY